MVKNLYSNLEIQVTRSLNDGGVVTRPVKTNGLWCHILLPTVLILYNLKYDVPMVYKLTTFISVGILVYSTLFILLTSVSCHILKCEVFSGITASSIISTLLIYYCFDYGILKSFLMSWSTICGYSYLLRLSLNGFPKTFTLGEATIVVQGIVLSTFMALAKLAEGTSGLGFIFVTISAFLFSIGIMVIVICLLNEPSRNVKSLLVIIVGGAVLCLILLHHVLGRYYLIDFIKFIFYSAVRIKIFSFWLFLLATSVVVVYLNTKNGGKANTATRKSFHILGSLVFMTGILFDVDFMTLSAGLAFGLLIFVEALRKSNIEPFSSSLQSAFQVYSDEKDVGSFAMTPLYLLVGLACPLLLVAGGDHPGRTLELLSGVLAIGVGDTAASWGGNRFGTHRWKDSQRTIEGTVSNILSQILTVYILCSIDVLNIPYLFARSILAASVSGLVEAKTDQVDNLILPLVTILAFQITSFVF